MAKPAVLTMIDGATEPIISNTFVNNISDVLTLQITGTFLSATVLVEGLVNVQTNAWTVLAAFNLTDLSLKTGNGMEDEGMYQVSVAGILKVRIRVSAITGGNITVAANFVGSTVSNQAAAYHPSPLEPITAYDLAVLGGYTGTLEQFETDMGNSAANAAIAAASAASVSASAAQIAINQRNIERFNAFDIWDGMLTRSSGTSHKVVYTWSGDVCTVTTPNGASDDYSANVILAASDLPASVVPGETYYVRYTTTLGGATGVRLRIIFRNASDTAISTAYFNENGSVTVPTGAAKWHVSLFVGSGVTLTNPVTVSNIHFLSAKTNRELEADTANLSDGLSKAVVTRGTLASGTDLDNVKTPGIWVLSSGYSYTNTPIPAGYAGMLLVFPASANSIGQIAYVMTSNMTALHYYVRSAVLGSFLAWKQIDGSGATYNSEYTLNHYDNTYNITCSPTITTDTNNYLAATGDDTDRTGDIQTMLNSTGVCHLGPGNFYVTGIDIPSYASLIGSGPRTRLRLAESVTDGYTARLQTYSSISNMRVVGGASSPELSATVGTRHGIIFESNIVSEQDGGTGSGTVYNQSAITNCGIVNFTGGGITLTGTGVDIASNTLISDCFIDHCGAGIYIPYYSEFHRISNCAVTRCWYGTVDNGGNNNFSNCDFSGCRVGIQISPSTNNSHGSFTNCSVNHSASSAGESNKGTAILLQGATRGEIFTGMQIFYGKIEIRDSVGIRFIGANVGWQVPIVIEDSYVVTFSDCTFAEGPASTGSPFSQSGNTVLKFSDCYLRDGTVYNPA